MNHTPLSPASGDDGGDTRKQPPSSNNDTLPPHVTQYLLQNQDAHAEDTLRTKNRSRATSLTSDLAGLFAPPPPPMEEEVTAKDPPPFPSEAPAMKPNINDSSQQSHRRVPSSVRFAPNHQRQVSWGLDSERDVAGGGVGLQQPDLANVADINVANNLLSQFRRQRGGSGRIAIEDLQNTRPMESEAEAYLIKALETRDIHSERKLFESGSVLTNVPRDDLDALQVEHDASLGTNPSRETLQRTSEGGSINNNLGTSPSGDGGSTVLRPPPIRRVPTKGTRQHRRDETVGDRLEGLTAAMDAVHLQHLDLLVDEHGDGLLPASLQNKVEMGTNAPSSADALHQNANLLFNRHRTQSGDVRDEEMGDSLLSSVKSDDSSGSTAASKRWKLLKNNLTGAKSPRGETGSLSAGIEEEPDEATSSEDARISNDREEASSDEIRIEDGERKPPSFKVRRTKNKFVAELDEFFASRREGIYSFLRVTIFVIILPSTGISALLFYLTGNPPTGVIDIDADVPKSGEFEGMLVNKRGEYVDPTTASASWWLLFLGVRQVVTFVMAKAVELFLIDFLSVRSRFSVKFVGPWVTLCILQAKGWPFLLLVWGILNFSLLSGSKPFFHHWAYWQEHVEWLNEANPSGQYVNSVWHHRAVAIAVSLGVVVSAKRFWLGLYLGRQTFRKYLSICMTWST